MKNLILFLSLIFLVSCSLNEEFRKYSGDVRKEKTTVEILENVDTVLVSIVDHNIYIIGEDNLVDSRAEYIDWGATLMLIVIFIMIAFFLGIMLGVAD